MKWKLWPVYSWASWNPECHLLATACNDMLSSRSGRPLLPTLPQWICIFSQELSKPSCFPCISQFLEHRSALITVIWMKTRCVYIWVDGWMDTIVPHENQGMNFCPLCFTVFQDEWVFITGRDLMLWHNIMVNNVHLYQGQMTRTSRRLPRGQC